MVKNAMHRPKMDSVLQTNNSASTHEICVSYTEQKEKPEGKREVSQGKSIISLGYEAASAVALHGLCLTPAQGLRAGTLPKSPTKSLKGVQLLQNCFRAEVMPNLVDSEILSEITSSVFNRSVVQENLPSSFRHLC